MAERFTRLFSLPENLYAEGSPVVIAAGALQKDTQTEKVFAQLKFKNITDKTIKAVKVKLFPVDTIGNAIEGEAEHEYLDLSVARDEEFGHKTAVFLPNTSTRGFSVEVTAVYFEDNSAWDGLNADWSSLPELETLEKSLADLELAKQYKLKNGADCKFAAFEHKDLWFCTCGALNHSGDKCCICRREFSSLKNVNLDELKAERDTRLEEERRKAEEDRNAAEERAEAMRIKAAETAKKTKKLTMILAPIVVIVVVAAVLISGAVKRNNAYNEAVALAEALKYDEAIAAFSELGNYKDSAEQAKATEKAKEEDTKRESYYNAVSLFEAGQHEEAYAAFEALGDYLDSKEYLARYERVCVLLSETYVDDGVLGFEKTYEYSNGLMVKETVNAHSDKVYGFHAYGLSNGDRCTAEYEYDSNRKKTEVRVYRKDGTQIHTYSYKYDNAGTLLEETNWSIYTTSKPVTFVYEYDEKGNVLSRTWYQNVSATGPVYSEHHYEYDEHDQLIYERYWYGWGGNTEITYENEYDSSGRLIKQSSLLTGDIKTSTGTEEYEYDDMGNLKTTRTKSTNGSGYEYRYEYDEFGNVVKRIYQNGDSIQIATYTYDYLYIVE